MSELVYQDADHRYTLDGFVVPSVTQVIDFLSDYAGVPADVMENARAIGDAAHCATELDDKGDLDEETVHPLVMPRLEAWRKFRRECNFTPTHIELRVFSAKHKFAGTLDRIGTMGKARILADIKCTASLPPTAGPQTAAYLLAANESVDGVPAKMDRYTVQLKPDGTYRLEQHKSATDTATFLAALHLFMWRKSKCK